MRLEICLALLTRSTVELEVTNENSQIKIWQKAGNIAYFQFSSKVMLCHVIELRKSHAYMIRVQIVNIQGTISERQQTIYLYILQDVPISTF